VGDGSRMWNKHGNMRGTHERESGVHGVGRTASRSMLPLILDSSGEMATVGLRLMDLYSVGHSTQGHAYMLGCADGLVGHRSWGHGLTDLHKAGVPPDWELVGDMALQPGTSGVSLIGCVLDGKGCITAVTYIVT